MFRPWPTAKKEGIILPHKTMQMPQYAQKKKSLIVVSEKQTKKSNVGVVIFRRKGQKKKVKKRGRHQDTKGLVRVKAIHERIQRRPRSMVVQS